MSYWSHKIEGQARREGEDEVFVKLMGNAVLPRIIDFSRSAQTLLAD